MDESGRAGVPVPRGGAHPGPGGPGPMRVGLRRDGAVTVLSVTGEVDLATAPRLRRDVLAALRGSSAPADAAAPSGETAPSGEAPSGEAVDGGAALVLDLTGVTFLGSAGLTVLVEARRAAGATAVRVAASESARRTIEVAGLTSVLAVHPSVAAALPT